MLRLAIITNGQREVLEVEQAQFVRHCAYRRCREEFDTVDPDQLYCKPSHRVSACKDRTMGTILRARLSISTIGVEFA